MSYRNEVFIPEIQKLMPYLITWNEDGESVVPNMPAGMKPWILIIHNESTFNANDGKRKLWVEKGKNPLRPKGRDKGIMVSDFLTPSGRLRIPSGVTDDKMCEVRLNPSQRTVQRMIEYGKKGTGTETKYWTCDDLVSQLEELVLPAVKLIFPDYIPVFLFDNSSNHGAYSKDALVASRIKLGDGSSTQPKNMNAGWFISNGVTIRQELVLANGQTKGMGRIL